MPKLVRAVLGGLMVIMGLVAVTAAQAAIWDIGLSHRTAIKQMLKEMGMYEVVTNTVKRSLVKMTKKNPEKAVRMRRLVDRISREQLDEILVPVYAYYFNKNEAEGIARFLMTRTGRMVIENARGRLEGEKKRKIKLTEGEELTIKEFFNSNHGRAFRQSMPFIKQELKFSGGILSTRLFYKLQYEK